MGILLQEPPLTEGKTVMENIEEAVAEVRGNVTGHIQEQVSRRLAALEPGDATLSS